ncbi:MAG: YggS family pyridoxal phosphate-dependent enzyme [Verrucomicrobia bacterium]|nr:YggS family pyridoxal phosphate-dependent enzyme [Verrucomicrobiota bacterium]
MNLQERVLRVQEEITATALRVGRDPATIKLVVVTKKQSIQDIKTLFDLGIRDFGESRIQEAEEKQCSLPPEISWHMIGHLQSNKVSKAVGAYSLIHSVDSLELARKISQKSQERGLITDILLEVNTSGEEAKHGLTVDAIRDQFSHFIALPALRIRGLMTMAAMMATGTFEEQERVRASFRLLATLKRELQGSLQDFTELSMGMSQDFPLAIEEGATLLRVGSRIFGL